MTTPENSVATHSPVAGELSPPSFGAMGVDPAGMSVKTLAVLVTAIAALYFGKDMLVPVALAGLLTLALEPLATRLRRIGLGRIGSVAVVMLLALLTLGTVGYLITRQAYQLAQNLPEYKENIQAKIRQFHSDEPGGGAMKRASTVLRELQEEIAGGETQGSVPAAGAVPGATPLPAAPAAPVKVEQVGGSVFATARDIAYPFLAPVGMVGLVIVFLVFMLLESENMRDRLIRLLGGSDLSVTTEGLGEATRRVSTYLRAQLLVNIAYGVPIGIGLYLIGVPNALLWGLLSAVLRFVPYLGAFIASFFPIVMALAVDPGWSMLIMTAVLIIVMEVVTINVVEPLVYGRTTGLSAVAIVLGAIFWTTLWGPVGLLLATPLTVCVVVAAHYLPQLHFLVVLLGNAPALSVQQRFYQRMLAGDTDEGVEMAGTFARTHPEGSFVDEVALPALCLAESDRSHKALSAAHVEALAKNVRTVAHELLELHEPVSSPEGQGARPRARLRGSVVCVAGRTGLDTAAADLLAYRLRAAGIGARVLAPGGASEQEIAGLDAQNVDAVIIVHLGESALAHVRGTARRIRAGYRGRIGLGLFNGQLPAAATAEDVKALGADHSVADTSKALEWISRPAVADREPMVPAPIPEREGERLAELLELNLLDTLPEERFDRITRALKAGFGTPIALLSLVDEKRQFWKSAQGLPAELAACRASARETSICGHVVALNDVLVVEDVLADPRFANNPFLRENGIRFYAGAPLRGRSGLALGSICVMDTQPRGVNEAEMALLGMAAAQVMREIEIGAQDAAGLRGPEEESGKRDIASFTPVLPPLRISPG